MRTFGALGDENALVRLQTVSQLRLGQAGVDVQLRRGQVGHFDDVQHSLGSSPLAGTSRQERKFCSQYSKRTGACPSKLLSSTPFDGTFAIFFRFRC